MGKGKNAGNSIFSFSQHVFHVYKSNNYFYVSKCFNPFPIDEILDSSKLNEFADNNFELDENWRRFSKRVENTVRKEEIACYEQFLLSPQCFSKDLFCRHMKTRACLGKG